MAAVNGDIPPDVRLNFRFRIVGDTPLGRFQDLQVQELTLPDLEVTTKEIGRGGGQSNIMVPLKLKPGEWSIKRTLLSTATDRMMQQWLILCASAGKSTVARNWTVQELGDDGSVVETHELTGVFPKKIAGRKFVRNDDGDVQYEEVTLSCDFLETLA